MPREYDESFLEIFEFKILKILYHYDDVIIR